MFYPINPCHNLMDIFIHILQIRKMRLREMCIGSKAKQQLSAEAKIKTWVCLTLKLMLLQQQHRIG